MTDVLATPPDDIAGVLVRLANVQEILDSLPPTPAANRVACFNSLYHRSPTGSPPRCAAPR